MCFVSFLVVWQNQVYLCYLCNIPRKTHELCSILLRHQKASDKMLNLTVGKSTVLSGTFPPHFKLNLQTLATTKPPKLASTRKVIFFFTQIRGGKSTCSSQNVLTTVSSIKKNAYFLLIQSLCDILGTGSLKDFVHFHETGQYSMRDDWIVTNNISWQPNYLNNRAQFTMSKALLWGL